MTAYRPMGSRQRLGPLLVVAVSKLCCKRVQYKPIRALALRLIQTKLAVIEGPSAAGAKLVVEVEDDRRAVLVTSLTGCHQ